MEVRAEDSGAVVSGIKKIFIQGTWNRRVCSGVPGKRVCTSIIKPVTFTLKKENATRAFFSFRIRSQGTLKVLAFAIDNAGNYSLGKAAITRF